VSKSVTIVTDAGLQFRTRVKGLVQGCQTPVLKDRCPAGFRYFPAPTHLIQIGASLAGLCRM